jgi:branched-chain amino acid transport system ATP-binding protein
LSTQIVAERTSPATTPPPKAQVAPRGRMLTAVNVTVRFEGLTAIGDVSLEMISGEILGLIGPNGAGKTTLVNVLSGFQVPGQGKVLLDGNDTAGWPAHRFRRRGIARTFQAGRLFRDMTVLENVEAAAVNLGLSRRQASAHGRELLDWIGLGGKADMTAGALPYTDERRLGIARALALAPAFALLDEPAAGMSELECDELMKLIGEIPKHLGCGILLIEHNMRVVMGACDRVHVLDGGRTIASGSPAVVQADPAVIAAYLGTGHRTKAAAVVF